MRIKSAVARRVRPMVGPRVWAVLRDVDRELRSARQRRAAERRAALELAAISGDLNQLAVHFGTDKFGVHRYTPHYQRHLSHLRLRPINLLEIGIGGYSKAGQGGASLRMWKQYFGKGTIYGLDVADKSFVEEPRISTFKGNQADADLLKRIVTQIGRLDVVIDDGSHRSEHTLATFQTLFPLLADDGIYVIEDTQTSYWPERGGSEDRQATDTTMGLVKRLVDGLNYEEFLDEAYEPTYSDLHVVGVHAYHNLVFIDKDTMSRALARQGYLRSDLSLSR